MHTASHPAPFVALSVLILVSFNSIGAEGMNETIRVPHVTIDRGLNSGIQERKFVVIRTAQEWEDLWRVHRSRISPDKPAPAFDVQGEMIVAVFAGEKRTGGYGIEIVRIEENGAASALSVVVRETSPKPKAIVIQVLTQPYHIVKLRRVDLPIVFKSGDPG